MLLGHIARHLKLLVLLLEALVELWQLGFYVLLDIPLLVFDYLLDFMLEAMLRLLDEFTQLVKHRVHQRR